MPATCEIELSVSLLNMITLNRQFTSLLVMYVLNLTTELGVNIHRAIP